MYSAASKRGQYPADIVDFAFPMDGFDLLTVPCAAEVLLLASD